MTRTFALIAALLLSKAAGAAELRLTIEIPRLEVAEYHRPYVAVWLERDDQSVAATLAVWYEIADRDGARWLADLRQWWRRTGREQALPIDAVTGATRPAGAHTLVYRSGAEPLGDPPAGHYTLVVEAVRESGGRETLRLPFEWLATEERTATARGTTELGAVTLAFAP